jgi:EAL domain-containing protein (putative c-di-GMP-specific phosphodiesterase class I)/CheY-like chemotaxis protein
MRQTGGRGKHATLRGNGGAARSNAIRVLLAEDKVTFRRAMGDLISGEPTLELAGAAGDAQEAIDLAERIRPDVALVDVKMPAGGGPRATREIRRRSPNTRIIALSAYEDRGIVLEMLQAGAVGYLVKGTAAEEIIQAIHRADQGKGTLSVEVTANVIDELSGQLERQDREAEARRLQFDRIRRVIDGPGPGVAFQPVVDLERFDVVGVEALARFAPEYPGPPDVWFADAATVGLLTDLELTAVRSAVRHMDEMPSGVWMSVNISPESAVSEGFLELVGPAAPQLVIEITEHAPVEDYDQLNEALRSFRNNGGRLAVDDAGAGFSSLRHILRLAPDFIKLDGALTRGIDTDKTRRALGAALISFANEIGVPIIAEGVETQAEVDALRALKVTWGQGFFLGEPGPLPPAVTSAPV